jgi:glucose/arabinose dehydrogenase
MSFENRPGSVTGMSDDELGNLAVALYLSELQWSPDEAPAVLDRISRDAVAYPDQFDRRPPPPTVQEADAHNGRSTGRTITRLLIFGVILAVVVAVVFVAASSGTARAAGADLDSISVSLHLVADDLDKPVLVTSAGDDSGRLYIVEQTGRVRIIDPAGSLLADPFLDLSSSISSGFERGLLGLAFHPAFDANGRIFVNYTRAQDGATVVSELSATTASADPESERELLVIEQPFGNHNGGNVVFDADGHLLVGMGDGGSGGDPQGNGQNPSTLLGKLLRLDVDAGQPYAIPADNGFAASDAHRPEIHAKGLRNPWRFSVDPEGGHVYIGDVGESEWEEISVLPAGIGGLNFGWSEMEGPVCLRGECDRAAYVAPALSYGRDAGCSIVGGHAYRGSSQPALVGVYLFGDFCSGRIWGALADDLVSGAAAARQLGTLDGSLSSFGVDDAGEIYAVDLDGRIYRVIVEEAT